MSGIKLSTYNDTKTTTLLPAPVTHKPVNNRRRKSSYCGSVGLNMNLDCAFMLLVLFSFFFGATMFDYLPFPGEPGYTNVVEDGIQAETTQTLWEAPLKRPPPVYTPSPVDRSTINVARPSVLKRESTEYPPSFNTPTTAAPTSPRTTTKRAKRDDSDRFRKAAQTVLQHDMGLEQAHIDGFRSAGVDEVTMQKLQRQLRVELRRRKRRSLNRTVGGLATTAGIAALQHVFQKFDLVPKAYKALSFNPGYERGVPRGHPRQLSYDFSGYANPRPQLAFGELGGRRLGRFPVTGLF